MKARALVMAVALAAAFGAVTAAQDSVAGTWHLQVVFDQGSGAPTAVFKQDGEKLTGTYTGQMGQFPLEGTFKDKQIAFTVMVDVQGNQLAFTYVGALQDDGTLKGTVDLGGMASGTWTGKKAEE